MTVANILSVDVEDYFHPSEVQRSVDPSRWDDLPSRVCDSTQEVLDLLAAHDTRATFFILGWVAHRFPALVRRIADAGHEVACHSFAHSLVYDLTPAQFKADTLRAVDAIAQASGQRPTAYRAPSYSVTNRSLWALEVLIECGFTTDSSIYPIHHDRYGIPGHPRHPHILQTPSGSIVEVPPATAALSPSRIVPVGGGGYLRLLPYRYSAAGIRRINHIEHAPACIYFHPWEIDAAQPRLASSLIARARTYLGLRGMKPKLARLLREFRFTSLADVCAQPASFPAFPLPSTPIL
jgi:polysaccharide deacetylase family protein (PEP-CTERM system associated)